MATKKTTEKKKCSACGNPLSLSSFYISKSPMFAVDGRVGVCKDCVLNSSVDEEGKVDEILLNKVLRQIDKPYYKDSLQSAFNQFKKEHSYVNDEDVVIHGKAVLRLYFKNIAMRQTINKSYCDSELEGFTYQNNNISKSEKAKIINSFADVKDIPEETEKVIKISKDKDFEVTDEIIELFGDGYIPTIYKKMHDKYEKLKLNYSIQTNLHQEALATYVRFKVQEEMATSKGDVVEAQKWYQAAQDAADKAKLTPKQLTQADLQGGINSFSEIFKAVEQAVDIIPILPQFKYRPNDALDFIMWNYVNYERDLSGMPQVDYEEIYKFYDRKVDEYIEQYGDPYGIFEDDTTKGNREKIKKFIEAGSE